MIRFVIRGLEGRQWIPDVNFESDSKHILQKNYQFVTAVLAIVTHMGESLILR